MSVAAPASPWRSTLESGTVRHFGAAVGIALLALAVGAALYLVERCVLSPERQFIENPGSVMMRAGGLTHFWIGWLFLFTSPRIRNRRCVAQLAGLSLLGVGLCVTSSYLGGLDNPFVYLFFFGYFLVHELRDEKELYRSRDLPDADGRQQAFLDRLMHCVAVTFTGIVCLGFVTYNTAVKKDAVLLSCPAAVYIAAAVGFAALAALTGRRLLFAARQTHGSLAAALAAHAPLVAVYGGILLVILLGALLAGTSFNLIILIHGGAWVVFVSYQLRRRPRPAKLNPWTWVRHTPGGFLFLHAAVLAFVLALMALRVHAWERTGFLSELVERQSFPYWSIMHITLALWRPR